VQQNALHEMIIAQAPAVYALTANPEPLAEQAGPGILEASFMKDYADFRSTLDLGQCHCASTRHWL
jgi:hypothetical protein